ncbi:response regulator transcription factor [Cohnella soli]|uniref:Response regulator n=1 Tax=Cohnella soli TaxID=425005 RepID=A0ABW0HRY4_9BACL
MVNLLIVDDEETTRNSLMELVPWSEWGIEQVRAAENGVAALALAEKFRPTILLTDIRMPKMNGIELAQRIRSLYPTCEIVFLSGFSDKAYLKSAIHVQAADYLDKPVNMEQLRDLFVNVVQKRLDLSNRKESVHYRREEIIVDLICKETDISVWLERAEPTVLPLLREDVYRVYTIVLNWSPAVAEHEKTLMKLIMLNAVDRAHASADVRHIAGFMGSDCLTVITGAQVSGPLQAKAAAERMLVQLQEAFPDAYTLSVGCSSATERGDAFAELNKSALEAASRQFYAGTNRIFVPPLAAPTGYDIDKAEYARFKKQLRSDSPERVTAYVRQLTADIRRTEDPDTSKIRNVYFNFMRALFEATMQWDIADATDDSGGTYMWREINTRITLDELAQLLLTHIEMTMQKPEGKSGSLEKIDEVKKYIASHYESNQLSIQTIAAHTHLSQTYLCALFKKTTGRTLGEYITELRIEKAKELLRDRQKKLYEVTTDIGLTDTNYFSTMFKKYTGCTPSEYRVKHQYD